MTVFNLGEHYTKGSIEPIDFIDAHNFNFNLGCAIKYISRCNHKGEKETDLIKAMWYLDRELGRMRMEEKCATDAAIQREAVEGTD